MINGSVETVVKGTICCSVALSQPFVFQADVFAKADSRAILQENHSFAASYHHPASHLLQQKLTKEKSHGINETITVAKQNVHRMKKIRQTVPAHTDAHIVIAMGSSLKKRELHKLERIAKELHPYTKREKVKKLQNSLHFLGLFTGEIDGIYGPHTVEALQKAQSQYQLEMSNTSPIPKEKNASMDQIDIQTNKNGQKTESQDIKNSDVDSKQDIQSKSTPAKPIKTSGLNGAGITSTAQSLVGTPYVWGGTTQEGFDCSGFVQYVFQSQGMTIPRTVNEVYNFSVTVPKPSIGDVVFFETYRSGPSHMGIYVGNNQFIHAGESRGVEVTELSNSYWKSKYLGAKRIKQ